MIAVFFGGSVASVHGTTSIHGKYDIHRILNFKASRLFTIFPFKQNRAFAFIFLVSLPHTFSVILTRIVFRAWNLSIAGFAGKTFWTLTRILHAFSSDTRGPVFTGKGNEEGMRVCETRIVIVLAVLTAEIRWAIAEIIVGADIEAFAGIFARTFRARPDICLAVFARETFSANAFVIRAISEAFSHV